VTPIVVWYWNRYPAAHRLNGIFPNIASP
jgi:hypothetical protein